VSILRTMRSSFCNLYADRSWRVRPSRFYLCPFMWGSIFFFEIEKIWPLNDICSDKTNAYCAGSTRTALECVRFFLRWWRGTFFGENWSPYKLQICEAILLKYVYSPCFDTIWIQEQNKIKKLIFAKSLAWNDLANISDV
jgi:hypothetical protein